MSSSLRTACLVLSSLIIAACGSDDFETPKCSESGRFACKSGETEPLYPFQWHLDASNSFFAKFSDVSNGVTDLNLKKMHEAGIKGAGVRVFVIDQGIEINHEDLSNNIDTSMSYNFLTGSNDTTPTDLKAAHGTFVAGIIAAVQNGFGAMGVAPKATIGGSNYMEATGDNTLDFVKSIGGAEWSRKADVFVFMAAANGIRSYSDIDPDIQALRKLSSLRDGKGAILIKAAGNAYSGGKIKGQQVDCELVNNKDRISSCSNANFDIYNLSPTTLVVGSIAALGRMPGYSTTGSVVWLTAPGGMVAPPNPTGWTSAIYSTDLTSCDRGISRKMNIIPPTEFNAAGTANNAHYNLDKNGKPNCNYGGGDGTSSAGPSVAGVVALMLEVNPRLTWRDVRDILRKTANSQVDRDYVQRGSKNREIDLASHSFCEAPTNQLSDGNRCARVEYGWQTNGAGIRYSNWYGFGLVDAAAAVAEARRHVEQLSAELTLPEFKPLPLGQLTYGRVRKVAEFESTINSKVDGIQIRVNGVDQPLCYGLVGFYLESPAGTISILQTPYNIMQNATESQRYLEVDDNVVLSSYAFYGEQSVGQWKLYGVSGASTDAKCTADMNAQIKVDYRILPQPR